jgi:hypothetical protein
LNSTIAAAGKQDLLVQRIYPIALRDGDPGTLRVK